MPGIKRTSSTIIKYNKKKGISKRSEKLYTNITPKDNGPVSTRKLVKLTYYELLSISISATSNSYYQYRLNSLYDPNYTGVGHQPYGYGTLQTLYFRYRVFKCGWKIAIPSINLPFMTTVVPINDTTTDTQELSAEKPMAVTKVTNYDGGQPIYFEGSVYLPNFNGTSPIEYRSDDRYGGRNTQNPSKTNILFLAFYNPNGSALTGSASVTLTYWAELLDPLPLSIS